MTALAQGSAGLALVMGFGLLVTGQFTAAAILLAAQSGAGAVTAVALHQPLMAIAPAVLAGGVWLARHETADPRTTPVGGVKRGIGVGAVLAILCQSLGSLSSPTAIVLLAILLAATRRHALMQVMALVAMQNGLALAGSLTGPATLLPAAFLFPIACLVLPLPLAIWLLTPAVAFVSWPSFMSRPSFVSLRGRARAPGPYDAASGEITGDRADPGIPSDPGRDTAGGVA